MTPTKSERYTAPYYGYPHGSSAAAKDYDEQITELRAGPKGWYEISMCGRLPKQERAIVVDDNFWRGLKVALGFTVVMSSLLAVVGYRLFS